MDCYFRQYWRDARLSFSGPIKSLSLSIKMLERIWRPDTYFYNGKQSYVHTITVPNKLLRLSSNGDIIYSMRLLQNKIIAQGDQWYCISFVFQWGIPMISHTGTVKNKLMCITEGKGEEGLRKRIQPRLDPCPRLCTSACSSQFRSG
jgi:hypothetical protein